MEGFVEIKVDRWFAINGDTQEIFSEVSDIMYDSVIENFNQGGRPRWAPLKSGKPSFLTDTHRLRNSFQKKNDDVSAEVSTDTDYAKFHQRGTKWMPMRPMLIFQEEDKENIMGKFKVGLIKFTDGNGNVE